ncbi:MAG: DUF3099 domain-containing protein [Saccharopolyspora sp.]|uniref:DUF3099 domain-containing protein n=1 Tax=Saccharopolyspora TaxID=1835 RepID=UPI00190D289B|nr:MULTISPECIES: DUF3099 domain-containing protein [unclassified Saccharopolyspora]MBK0868852.1 DUF3099 domain-containing protein [Saccharopolyspora sp. HNM0986]MBQ6642064.1 DUF3099 domain-containing protein [Saccharopolyspora sp.]
MRRGRQSDDPALITDAEPSFDEEQRHRKRVYAVLMVVHLVGFTAAGLLAHIWWLALAIVIVTGALPWVAVVLANDRTARPGRRRMRRQERRAVEDRHHDHIDTDQRQP